MRTLIATLFCITLLASPFQPLKLSGQFSGYVALIEQQNLSYYVGSGLVYSLNSWATAQMITGYPDGNVILGSSLVDGRIVMSSRVKLLFSGSELWLQVYLVEAARDSRNGRIAFNGSVQVFGGRGAYSGATGSGSMTAIADYNGDGVPTSMVFLHDRCSFNLSVRLSPPVE